VNVASFSKWVRPTECMVFVQAAILGFLFGELWYFTQAIASEFNKYILSSSRQGDALVACGITGLIGLAYIYSREGYSDLKRLGQSYRVDLLAIVALGLLVSVCVGGVGTSKYQEYVGKVYVLQLMLLVFAPVVIALMLMLKAAMVRMRSDSTIPFFISDQDIKSKEDDLLGLSDSAARFAERVLNGGSADSLVFGIDAPWGIGKSSFVNFCCEYWQDKSRAKIIIHRFEPLRYEDKADLAEKFVNDLVSTIQKHAFVPAIRPLFSKYSRLIKGKSDFSFLGLQFAFEPSPETVEDTLENLEVLLSELNKKIIIVVDDLDRLSWSAIKNILFAIKRSFMLPNVSYVLCYDTENIVSTDKKFDDAEKVKEFLEKFVNVKISLFLDSSALANYVSTNFDRSVRSNLQMDPHTQDEIKQAIKELVKIFNSEEFFHYQDFVGDIRKLKRLINTLVLLEIEKTDFENSDFNKEDLIHLLLVYVNYPHIFRKIYNTEANGKDGFFSLVLSIRDGTSRFENSKNYDEYVKELTTNQQFLLGKLFGDGAKDPEDNASRIGEAAIRSRACFNGSGGSSRNLERYLNLIVKLSKQDKREGYQFYVNKKNELLQGKTLDEIFGNEEFDFSKGDFSHNELWNVIVNSTNELEPKLASQVVTYLMERLPGYSLLEGEKVGVGSRTGLIYSLLKLLDDAAWGSSQAGRRNNSPENISEIADWVFGERSHIGSGVVSTLAKVERGPLGLFDLMLFRLYCSADRGGSLFNLQRALSLHGDPAAPTSGLTTEIAKEEMREISQAVFQIFKDQYITSKKNIFEAIDNLSLDDYAGEFSAFVRAQIESGAVNQDQIDQLIAIEKSKMKIFIVYQLGNKMINSGVGCGFYDETGKEDRNGIATKVNEYLFDQCFNPTNDQENFERFLDYLLMNFVHTFGWNDGVSYEPTLGDFTKVLEKERLKEYWKVHKTAILELDLSSKKKSVITSNYVATYEVDLNSVYRVLDELIS
jgi:hypothetical protein